MAEERPEFAEERYRLVLAQIAQQVADRQAVRTRTLTTFSAAAVVISLVLTHGIDAHPGPWLVAAVFCFILIGFTSAIILGPVTIRPLYSIIPEPAEPSEGGSEEPAAAIWRRWTEQLEIYYEQSRLAGELKIIFYSLILCLLVLEVALSVATAVAATSARVACSAAAGIFVVGYMVFRVREDVNTVHDRGDVFFPRLFLRTTFLYRLGRYLAPWRAANRAVVGLPGVAAETASSPDLTSPALQALAATIRQARSAGESEFEDSSAADAAAQQVVTAFRAARVLTLGHPAGKTSVGADDSVHGTESDLLHFATDIEGAEKVFLPVFTGADALDSSLVRNTEWGGLSVLEVNGNDLQDNVDRDVTIVIDPWTEGEWQLPPGEGQRTAAPARPAGLIRRVMQRLRRRSRQEGLTGAPE